MATTIPVLPGQQLLPRLPPDVNRILYVKSLPFKISIDDLYDIFGKFGPVRQIRLGNTPATRGKAFVVYEDIYDAQRAVEHLNGFNIMNRYLVVLYHNPKNSATTAATGTTTTTAKPADVLAVKKAKLDTMKKRFGVKGLEDEEDTPTAAPAAGSAVKKE